MAKKCPYPRESPRTPPLKATPRLRASNLPPSTAPANSFAAAVAKAPAVIDNANDDDDNDNWGNWTSSGKVGNSKKKGAKNKDDDGEPDVPRKKQRKDDSRDDGAADPLVYTEKYWDAPWH